MEEKRKNKKYSGEFKILVVEDILNNKLAYYEVRRKYFPHISKESGCKFIKKWVELYETEGRERLLEDRRGKASCGRPKKAVSTQRFASPEEELEYLRAENEYLKKAIALAKEKQDLQNTTKRK